MLNQQCAKQRNRFVF
uniref:Uncharacterized protein n=1 Tax=Anguilla anguilla TaxID=7936 RepID=A0A0E9V5I9_ANGAN